MESYSTFGAMGGGMAFLFLILYIAILALFLWIGYKITKAAIRNALDESEIGKYFKKKNMSEPWNDQQNNTLL